MGIDIYAKWEGQTNEEYEAQITGFDTTAGKVGYLREAYHGGPYVTNWLMPEAFSIGEQQDRADSFFNGGVEEFMGSIFTALGAEPGTAVTAEAIAHRAGDGFPPDGYFVSCPEIRVPWPKWPDEEPALCAAIPGSVLERRLPLCEAIYAERCHRVYGDDPSPAGWQSFVDFVAFYRALEQAGKVVGVYASW